MVAKITATSASIVVNVVCCDPADIRAPINVIPEIAFDPDINGVCNVGGTFVITSKPTNIARTKTVRTTTNDSILCNSSSRLTGLCTIQEFIDLRINYSSLISQY